MPFLFVLISINVMSVPLILALCGKKENENNGTPPATQSSTNNNNQNNKVENNTVQIKFTPEQAGVSKTFKRSDIYHEVAEHLAFPASARCKNHDDAWRILALYLDYIRAVNPVEFEQFRMLDSGLAVLHDFSYLTETSQIANETLALAVIYFLVDFHKIKVNLGSPERPWYTILCRNAKLDEMESMKAQMDHCLVESDGSSAEFETIPV